MGEGVGMEATAYWFCRRKLNEKRSLGVLGFICTNMARTLVLVLVLALVRASVTIEYISPRPSSNPASVNPCLS